MDWWQSVVNLSAVTAGFAALAGLVVRQRARRAACFALFLALVSVYGLVVALWPGLIAWRVWLLKEVALSLVALAAGLEIGIRMFARRRGARPRAGLAVLAVVVLTLAFLAVARADPTPAPMDAARALDLLSFELACTLLPRLSYGTAWLFTTLWLVARRFAVPLDAWHEAVLLGSATFWVVQALSLGLLDAGDSARWISDALTLAFLVVVLLWACAAWRRDESPPAPTGIVREVWPWA